MINFYFDDIQELRNCFDSQEIFESGMYRITTSPFANAFRRLKQYYSGPNDGKSIIEFHGNTYDINLYGPNDKIDSSYIIPIGLNQSPNEWIGSYMDKKYENFKNLFDKLSDKSIEDLRSKKAFVMFDTSLEGYHIDHIFDYFYESATYRYISPSQVIYITGNSNIEERLEDWKSKNLGKTPIHVIPYSHFEFDISERRRNLEENQGYRLPSYLDQLNYKKENINNIKVYNFLNKKPREHRAWMYHTLKTWNLTEHGLISMNPIDTNEINIDFNIKSKKDIDYLNEDLPTYAYGVSNEIEKFSHYMYNFNEQSTLDSWFSIISETHFEDRQGTIFLSEKTFKPIACNHPFIILGNKHSLKKLRKLGYKTFHDLIDETYDELDSINRIDAIADIIRHFISRENKLEWFEWMEQKLKYNSMNLRFNALYNPPHGFHYVRNLLLDSNRIYV